MELTTVAGRLEKGVFHPHQPLPPQDGPAVLTFVLEAPARPSEGSRPRFSFDEALALSAGSGVTISDAVIEERREYE